MTESSAKPPVQDGLAFERPLSELQTKIDELRKLNSGSHLELSGEIELLADRLRRQTADVYAQLSPWERVNVARHAARHLLLGPAAHRTPLRAALTASRVMLQPP